MKKFLKFIPILVLLIVLIIVFVINKDVRLSTKNKITKSGEYTFTGKVSDMIYVDVSGEVNITLDNVTVSLDNSPCIYVKNGIVTINLLGKNNLSDGKTYSINDEKVDGVIFSKDDLIIEGDGVLNIVSNYKNGIVSNDVLTINGGEINIESVNNAIKVNDEFILNDGTLNLRSENKGIKSENVVNINGGVINVSDSYEGIEGKTININDGIVNITSSDDGINAVNKESTSGEFVNDGSLLNITGGIITIDASKDGVDSNGDIIMSGGTLVINGPVSDGDGSIDKNGTFTMIGGTLLAGGMSGMAEMPTSGQNSVMIKFTNTISNKTIYIKQNDKTILQYSSNKKFDNLVLSSEELESGTYQIYIDDEEYESFTINGVNTIVGKSNNFNKRGGGR